MRSGSISLALLISGCLSAGCSLPDPVTLRDGPVTYYSEWEKKEVTHDQRIVRMREKWPVGVPLQIAVSLPVDAKRTANSRELTVKPMFPGAKTAKKWMHPKNMMVSFDLSWRPGLQEVGTLPPNATKVLFRVTMKDRMVIPHLPVSWTTLERPVTQVATIDEATTPVQSDELTNLIARDLVLEANEYGGRPQLAWTFPPKGSDFYLDYWKLNSTQSDRDAVTGISIALRVSFRYQDAEVARARFFVSEVRHMHGPRIEGDLDRLREGLANPEGWTVVIESDPEMALLDIENDRYWSGRFERPLSTVKIRPKPQPR